MFSVHDQRYQKTQLLSRLKPDRWKSLGLWLTLSLAVAGCSGGKATADEAVAGSGSAAASLNAPRQLASVQSSAPLPEQRQAQLLPSNPVTEKALIDAREAMQKKQWSRLVTLLPQAQADPVLGSYPEYWLLRQTIQDRTTPIPVAQIEHFMANNQDAYLADRIKGDWIVAAALAGDFAKVNQLGPVLSSNANIDCSQLLATHLTGGHVSAPQAMKAFRPATVCWTMLDTFYADGIVGWDDVRDELRATLETTRTANARRLAAILFDGAQMKAYTALMENPKRWLATQKQPATRAQNELVTLALSRLARGKSRPAESAYIDQTWAAQLPAADLEWVWGQFGLVSALNVEPQAAQWYRRSGTGRKTDYNHAWEVRSELRQSPIDWALVDAAIQKMTALQQSEPVWVYWRGRALASRGDTRAAEQHFASIQHELDFYGLLASEELGRPLSLPPMPAPVTQAEVDEARRNPGLQRAIRLFDLGWRPEAVPEWNFSLRGLNDRQLLAAAEVARQEAIYDRVVNTSLRTKDEINAQQRFIAPFEGRVTEKAREINLDPAWVYGLIRQESRFITDARSRVGASGLMQLMPATAKWVAQKIGMKNFTPSSVNDFDTNTILGTRYLGMVLDQVNGSEVLATAGYNAGPGRPVRWRAQLQGPVEGAVFAETIPFTETRLYVKHVLSNAVYYALLFNDEPQSLKARLGMVMPQGSTQVALP